MPVTVKTFTTSGEAAAALSSDRSARYLGGGTLVMRALNEGDLSISTIVRATDPALTRIDIANTRVTIGAGVTFARILAERDLAFLHAPARSIGGPAVRNMGTVGGNLFAPGPRSEEHTSELQSRPHLGCRHLLEKKKSSPASRRHRIKNPHPPIPHLIVTRL